MTASRIPPVIHIIWVGDESRRPEAAIDSWRRLNPAITVRVWGNADLAGRSWRNAHHMTEMWDKELNGVADLMRYEILFDEGGFAVDADCFCLRPLDDFLFEHDPFACWENEIARPGLISCGFFAASPGNPMIGTIIDDMANETTLTNRMAWESTGPLRLTQTVQKLRYSALTIFPSHFFLPRHYTGVTYSGPGRIYADHYWGSTQRILGQSDSEQKARTGGSA